MEFRSVPANCDENLATPLRDATHADLEEIVAIHLEAFPGFFLSKLGPAFLRELYAGFISRENGIALVAGNGKNLVGFAVGTTEPKVFFGRLLRQRWFHFLRVSIQSLLREPVLVGRKLLGALTYRGESPKLERHGTLLSSLAVSPSFAGRGQGASLVQAFCELAESRGANYVYLTTDRDNNSKVNAFYNKVGFELHGQFDKGGRSMNLYVRSCGQCVTPQAA